MSTSNPAQQAFELWRKSMEEGTQAWLRALGQAAVPPVAPSPPSPFDVGQLWRPILTQGMEMWQKAAAQGTLTPEFMKQWKSLVDQSIEAWSKALGQAMATEEFAQALGGYLDQLLVAQAPLRKGLEQYTETALRTMGLPSRGQVVGMASQLIGLEERIEGVEDRLDEIRALLKDALRAGLDHEAAAPRRAAPTEATRRAARPKEAR